MNLHDNVILDLLPLVRSGHASAESRQLVEQYLLENPQVARVAALLPMPDPALELRALQRTRRTLARAGWLQATAIFFTFLPLSFVSDGHGFRFLLAGYPAVIAGSLGLALGLWIHYFIRARRALA